jgi:hypothetical protein
MLQRSRAGRPAAIAWRAASRSATAWIALVVGVTALHASGLLEMSFRRLDRTYEALVEELAPIEIGPARVRLRSPEHSLRILRHRATLAPSKAGGHDVALEVSFTGQGRVEADVEMGAVVSQLADDLVVPEQTLSLEGRAGIARTEEGYQVTVLAVPESVSVKIQSRLAGRLVGLCRPMTLVLVSLDCAALEQALGSITVPLPEPGAQYLLPFSEVDADERARFDAYLDELSGVAPATPPS